ncbi:single-stranded-DNA-specific exonuclease RecJ [Bacillus sp. PS06]|uniref:single-stranded-DNA-specific exonuclease RecJ n=1 Tax=Bacillus sp. PS06 TaxID=2764176 RepID=UPI001787422E|nr:single-stranded-DNA-specific exonuclease RecJ [Bacillus sp. PS06]MBD8069316.1 single-stranded-DNA-specific exonuclease RecJ [Bacillus sp. PS06]
MLKSKTRWDVNRVEEEIVKELSSELNIAPLVASLLVNRGIKTVDDARDFLFIENSDFHDPFLLDEMDITIERIQNAIKKQEKILIFGDYDADGVSSTTVLLTALRECGADVDFYIPNRFTEGYGPNEAAFRWAYNSGYGLIITVDTGISALHEAQVAKDLGMDLIITDHHEPGPELPNAFSIIHPKKPTCSYPFKELAGVGVAFKVAHALLGRVPEELLEIAAIGTIADLVPLHGENRLLAKKGIIALGKSNRPGIKALLKVCGTEQSDVNEETIGFAIGPRINAVGRLDSADPAVHLLMTTDLEEARELAEEVDAYNKQRQQLVNEMTKAAIEEVETHFPPAENGVLVIAKEGWNAGVVGIVASRLVDRFYRPTIVLSIDTEKGTAKGSARSIEGFNLYENLSLCRDILPHFGGHPMAAGMTLALENVDELRDRLNELANEQLTEQDFIPVTKIDVDCQLSDISIETIAEMNLLAPFGMNNPKPRVRIKDVSIQGIRKIGSDQNHLKMTFEENGFALDSIGFGLGEAYDHVSPGAQISVIGELSINEWNNFRKPQIMLHDLAISHWQLFDMRGNNKVKDTILKVSKEKRRLIAFSEEIFSSSVYHDYKDEIIVINDLEQARDFTCEDLFICLLDLPRDETVLRTLLEPVLPSRIYTLFSSNGNHFFSTIPTREHFKWLYGFLAKRGTFDMNRYGLDLAKHKGWSKETIDFILEVFFELEFVKIDKGIITLSNQGKKRDLTESKTYQLKQQQIEIENKFLYSSYQQLKQWFDSINNGSLKFEEAMK